MAIGESRWGNGQVKCFGVGVSNVEGVLQVHLECIAAPTDAIFDEDAENWER
jgi:hypothetical protein